MFDHVIYGIQLYRHPGPAVEELKKDIALFRQSGFNCVRVQQVWSYEEPEEGVYDFVKLNEIIAAAAELQLDVIVTFTLENVPPWLHQRHDIYQCNAYGEAIKETTPYPLPSDGKPGPCWDNPVARAAAERFVRAFMEQVGASPAIKGFALWQEPTILPREDPRGIGSRSYCHCPHTLERFRLWLRAKYGSLQALNGKLMTNFAQWDYIEPPVSFMNPVSAEFCHFMRERMASITAWKRETVARHDRLGRPMMCHAGPALLNWAMGGGWHDDYMLAKNVDIYGQSFYPMGKRKRSDTRSQLRDLCLKADSMRSAAPGKPVWAAELQCGRAANAFSKCDAPESRDIVNWTLMSLARGVKGFVYWAGREEIILNEAYGHGILNRRGEPKPWLDGLAGALHFLRANDDVLGSTVFAQPEVALAMNTTSFILGYQSEIEDLPMKTARGLYTALFDLGVVTDFIWNEQVEDEGLAKYKVLVMPFPLSMTEAYAVRLASFVENGGVLISEACPGAFNELSNATMECPAFGLDRVFGCREKDITSIDTAKDEPQTEYQLQGAGAIEGMQVPAHHFIQTYELGTGREILSWNGEPAGVVNNYGRGKAVLVGTFYGAAGGSLDLTRLILEWTGIKTDEHDVALHRLTAPAGEALFFFNRADAPLERLFAHAPGLSLRCAYGLEVKTAPEGLTAIVPAQAVGCVILENQSDGGIK